MPLSVVESVYESFRAESLSQLLISKIQPVTRYPELPQMDMIVGYGVGCYYHAYLPNPKRVQATLEAKTLAL